MRLILTLSLLFLAFGCYPALAQERYPDAPAAVPFVEYQPADPFKWDDGEVGFFYFFNQLTIGIGTQTIIINTNVGEVILELDSTKNNQCVTLCPDTLTVIDWPQGYSVYPPSITVEELEMGFITLFQNYSS